MKNKERTHCKNGHEFNIENTYIVPKSRKRLCKICQSKRKLDKKLQDPEGYKLYVRNKMREWRSKNKIAANKQWTNLRRKKKEWIELYKRNKHCIKCDESDPDCLDFHHRDPGAKEFTISMAVARASLERIQTEIAKCDIICSNCHRKIHAAERRSKEL